MLGNKINKLTKYKGFTYLYMHRLRAYTRFRKLLYMHNAIPTAIQWENIKI